MYISIDNLDPNDIKFTNWYLFDTYTDDVDKSIWKKENDTTVKSAVRIPNSYLSITSPRYIKAIITLNNNDVLNYPAVLIDKQKIYTNFIIKDPVEKPILKVLENKLLSSESYLKLGITNIRTREHKQKSVTIVFKNLKNEIVFNKIFETDSTEFIINLSEISHANQLEDVDIYATQTSITGQSSELVGIRLHLGGVVPNVKNIQLNAFNSSIDNKIELTTNEVINRLLIYDNTGTIFEITDNTTNSVVIPANTLSYTRNYKMVIITPLNTYVFYIYTLNKNYILYDNITPLNFNIEEIMDSQLDLNFIKGYATRAGFYLVPDDNFNNINLYNKNLQYITSVPVNLNIDITNATVEYIDGGVNNTYIVIYKDNDTNIIKLFHNNSFTIVNVDYIKTFINLKSNIIINNNILYFIDSNNTIVKYVDDERYDLYTIDNVISQYKLTFINSANFLILTNQDIFIFNQSDRVLDKLDIAIPNGFISNIITSVNILNSNDVYFILNNKIYLYKSKEDILEEHITNINNIATVLIDRHSLLLKTPDKLYRVS